MLVRIDPQSAEPIAAQICFAVKEAVARAKLRPGERLPSVRELARELAVNPNTVVRAYDRLTQDGVLVRRQGAGCFVSERKATLKDRERRRQLDAALQRVVTDAFHLGLQAEDVRRAVERALADVQFPTDEKKARRSI